MDVTEIRKTAALEDRHWWFRERRHLLASQLRRLTPGRALDIGAAGGGNTRVLRDGGWSAVSVEYNEDGTMLARDRGLVTVRADAVALPFTDRTVDLVAAFDVLEHIEDDSAALAEIARVMRPGATLLVTVPCDMSLWSAHDTACDHYRRYSREMLRSLIQESGLLVERLWSWNVLLRPLIRIHRRSSTGSDTKDPGRLINASLTTVVRAERYLPVGRLPGVTLVARARRTSSMPLLRPQGPGRARR